MNTQFKKGILELCVLSLVNQQDCYGYQLVEAISKRIEISEGTMYPILRRLTKEELFTTYLKESNEGPPRKYYKITQKGEDLYKKQKNEWSQFTKDINYLLNLGERNE